MSRAERDWVDALRAQFPVTGQGAFLISPMRTAVLPICVRR